MFTGTKKHVIFLGADLDYLANLDYLEEQNNEDSNCSHCIHHIAGSFPVFHNFVGYE